MYLTCSRGTAVSYQNHKSVRNRHLKIVCNHIHSCDMMNSKNHLDIFENVISCWTISVALWLERRHEIGRFRFNLRLGHTKQCRNGTRCLPAWHLESGGKSLPHTSIMSRGCTCASGCHMLQKQDIGSRSVGLHGHKGFTYFSCTE